MTAKRRYRLQCPIARALDAVGDRWALLILRDLHAGPARFQQLESGLGIATNLLTTRLRELTDAGLVRRTGSDTRAGYELTGKGRSTDRVLWELTRFGALLDRESAPREPGNLRTLALPLKMMLASVEDRPELAVGLQVDDDRFAVVLTAAEVTVTHGQMPDPADLVVHTDYEALLDVGDGQMGPEEFATHHIEVMQGASHAPAFLGALADAMAAEEGTTA